MMEAADHGRLDDSAFVESLHRSWLRGVLRHARELHHRYTRVA
jgi:hypothetical protein